MTTSRRQVRASALTTASRFLLLLLALLLAGPTGLLSSTSTATTTGAPFSYDLVVRSVQATAPSAPLLNDFADSLTQPPAASRGPHRPRSIAGVAAEGATPLIKAGTAGGETAGKAFPQSVKDAALAENPGTCVYCRMETSTPRIDHAIPKSRGGNATLDNAQTTCPWCNGSKNNRDFPMNPPPGYEGGWPPPWWGIFG